MFDILISALLSIGNIGAFAILAVGIVMIYRASKVLNLAHGAMVMFPPYVLFVLSTGTAPMSQRLLACAVPAAVAGPLVATLLKRRLSARRRMVVAFAATVAAFGGLVWLSGVGLPLPFALTIALVAGGALGYLVERVFVRTLRGLGPTAQTVGTVAALGVVVAISAKVFGDAAQRAVGVFPDGIIEVSQSSIRYGEIGLFVLALVLTGGLITLLLKTDLGLMMRGTAENRRAAALGGVDPDRITSLTWVIGGGLAGLSGILLASVTNLHPYVLSLQALPAFVAALLGGMGSPQGAVLGAAAVAVTLSVFPSLGPLEQVQGAPQLFLALAAVGAMVSRGQRIVGGDVRSDGLSAVSARGQQRGLGGLATVKRPLAVAGGLLFLAFPFLPGVNFSIITNVNVGARYTMIAASLVILIGWVGQISLGHAALVGVGAYMTGWFAEGLGIPFPLNVPLAGVAAAGIAALLGMVAVRVRGLFLAVATLIFSWLGSEFLFRQEWFTRHFRIDDTPIGQPGGFPFFDFTDPRTMYYVAWALAGIGLFAAANLRDSKTGRAFFAVQGSEMAAGSLGVDVTRYKVLAFAISGFLAGVAGNLVMSDARVVSPDQFTFTTSLFLVAVAVVGGLRSLGGTIGAGLLFAMLDELFFRVSVLSGFLEVVSAGLLAVVLLAYPGGLAGLGSQLAHALGRRRRLVAALSVVERGLDTMLEDLSWGRRRLGERVRARLNGPLLDRMIAAKAAGAAVADADLQPEPSPNGHRPSSATTALAEIEDAEEHRAPTERRDTPAVVEAREITVRFGGLVAVDDVSLQVREGEIVGLIGPNGAGKTVTFNSIAGIVVPQRGSIHLRGQDVTQVPIHERARLGIARTFQALQLFPQLTVFENLLVGTHLHNDTGVLAHLAASPPSIEAERAARQRVREVIDLLRLEDVADKRPGDLPFGILRMVEIARALVTDLGFIMLDEATSGLDDRETDWLITILRRVRGLGRTILLIEHDVQMVMSVSDYVYVLDRGRLIAEGLPADVQRNEMVIAAYLGSEADSAPEPAGVSG